MPIAKQYLRYVPGGTFGVVASPSFRCVVNIDADFQISGRSQSSSAESSLVAVAACESCVIWDFKTGEQLLRLSGAGNSGSGSAVTAIAASPDKKHIAVGYEDGVVHLFDLSLAPEDASFCLVFSGHKRGVTSINFDSTGTHLASASKDTTIIVWDVVAEAGVVRLKGHKDAVTQVRFLRNHSYLISSSKDTLLKFWDLETHHCFKTVPGHKTEIWDFDLIGDDESFLVTGSTDNEIRLWQLLHREEREDDRDKETEALVKRRRLDLAESVENDDTDEERFNFETAETEDEKDWISCLKVASILRDGKERVVQVGTDASGRVLGVHGNDNQLELFLVRTEDEMDKLRKKRLKKTAKKKKKKKRKIGELEEEEEEEAEEGGVEESDRLVRLKAVKPNKAAGGGKRAKIKGFHLHVTPSKDVHVSLLMHNNLLSFFSTCLSPSTEPAFRRVFGSAGHRSDSRAIAFSKDGFHLLTAAAESLKVWTLLRRDAVYPQTSPTFQLHPISTIPCEYALSVAFLPGDRHAVVGAKSGVIQLFDVAAASLLQTFEAHGPGECWSVCVSPDSRALASGGGDKTLKFWDFQLVSPPPPEHSDPSAPPPPVSQGKQLTLKHNRTLALDEAVLGVKYTPDSKLIAVSLLDATVKIFFCDSLKFFLSLYGHKLPVLAMDVSSDSTLIATASADRNVKIWGLDFGDCHKSIFAHEDSILGLRFIPKTHLFFTCGKDGKINQWDADNFSKVVTLQGHQDDVLAIDVTQNGGHVISAGRDRSLRLWNKTKEIVVPDEEEEEEREKEFEAGAVDGEGEGVVAGEDAAAADTGRPGKRTLETIKMAERLLEALQIYEEETRKAKIKESIDGSSAQLHPMFIAYDVTTPQQFILTAMKRIKAPELEESLLILPFHKVTLLLNILLELFDTSVHETELLIRMLVFVMKVHHGQISTSLPLLQTVRKLRVVSQARIAEKLDQSGFNLAGLLFLRRRLEEEGKIASDAPLFHDATEKFKQKNKKHKKSKTEGEEAVKTAAILTIA